MNSKTVLIFSGGLDSTVLLHHLLDAGTSVHALTVNYGQRHAREIQFARTTAARRGIEHRVLDLSTIAALFSTSALTNLSMKVPRGHYEDDSMKQTVVPNRNMLLIATATTWAIALKADSVTYGAHAGDHTIYPDCRPEFADALDKAVQLADWHPLHLERPFIGLDKAQIVRRGHELGVPFAQTWSCYTGDDLHCGACGTCVERREAFHKAGIDDPTQYSETAPTKEQLVHANWRI